MATVEHPVLPSQTIEREPSLLDRIAAENSARYMPTLTVKQFTEREKQLGELKSMLVEKIDYGVIPGTDKPVLLLPGAQKLCTFFGYAPHYELESIEDWGGKLHGEPLFYYKYTCVLSKDGKPVGEGQGSCNSWESKYRYRWVKEDDVPARFTQEEFDALPRRDGTIFEFDFAVTKAETSGKYGKPKDYWDRWNAAIDAGEARQTEKETKGGKRMKGWEMGAPVYRVPNDQFADIINTCQKMGQKRAYVAATLSATGASQYFTQDLEETETLDEVRDRRIAEETRKSAPPAEPEDAELTELLGKLSGQRANDDSIMGTLCNQIDEVLDGEGTASWERALNKFGDPALLKNGKSLEATKQIVRYLHGILKGAKAHA